MAGGKGSSGNTLGKGAAKDKEKRGFRSGTAGANKPFNPPIFGENLSGILHNMTRNQELAMCDQYITPPCIAAMYNISQANKAAPGNQLGIFEEGDFYAAEDLIEFFATLAPNIPILTRPQLRGIDGGFAPGVMAGGESDLDFQISYPIVYPQQEVLFQTDDFFYATGLEGGGGFLNTFFDAIDGSYCTFSAFGETGDASIDPKYPDPNPLGFRGQRQCGAYKPTNVISISYGEQEDDLPTNYQQRQCAEVQKLGMQGVTVVIASGDSGVAARGTDDGNADGCLGTGEVFSKFPLPLFPQTITADPAPTDPDFPATCPYLTAAGATFLPPGASAAKDQEVAVTRFPSGGGFSNIYPRPSYQDTQVNAFFANHNPPYKSYSLSQPTNNPTEAQTAGGLYNKAGRGYPDISAVGDNVVVFVNGAPMLIGGTSASAPVFASIINRVNEERIAAGKSTVGFVNPTLVSPIPPVQSTKRDANACAAVRPPRAVPRHHHGQQQRVQHRRLLVGVGVGSGHGAGDAELPGFCAAVPEHAVIGRGMALRRCDCAFGRRHEGRGRRLKMMPCLA